GQLIFQAISSRDYPVIEACSLVLAVAFVLLNVIIDTGHALIDPRVRQ
ncbi:MAG: peptide/nickel transport system permease protein, partial [Acidimicrobiaceae bacterium]|nr:peptide/nickel transport system permease protein [Acidimicrobiaceae bacterium]